MKGSCFLAAAGVEAAAKSEEGEQIAKGKYGEESQTRNFVLHATHKKARDCLLLTGFTWHCFQVE